MWGRSDHIWGTYRRRFEMVGIRGVRNYSSYHLILQYRLLCPTEVGHHCDMGVPPAKMGTVHGDREDISNYQTYEGVVSGHGTGDRVTRR